jgi:hypothetical protein
MLSKNATGGSVAGRRKRVVLSLAAAVVATLAGTVVAPSSASASYVGDFIQLTYAKGAGPAEANGGCRQGYFCAWKFEGYTGPGAGWYNDDWNYADASHPTYVRNLNNATESWWNHGYAGGADDVQAYNTAGGTGTSLCIRNGTTYNSSGYAPYAHIFSAHVWRSSC